MIFVTVGSRFYQFDRLFQKLDELFDKGILAEEMFAQTGASTYTSRNFPYSAFLTPDEFQAKIKEADIVVSHGASGSILAALNAGKKLIAVTRLAKYGEHIDDHQISINEALSSAGYVLDAGQELEYLAECFAKIYAGTDNLRTWINNNRMSVVEYIDRFISETWSGVN